MRNELPKLCEENIPNDIWLDLKTYFKEVTRNVLTSVLKEKLELGDK